MAMFGNQEDTEALNKPDNATIVGAGVKLDGEVKSEGDIKIAGEVTGKVVTTARVDVEQGAKIDADLEGELVNVNGVITGNIVAKASLILGPSSEVKGNISAATLKIEEGAQFNGQCVMGDSASPSPKGTPSEASQNLE